MRRTSVQLCIFAAISVIFFAVRFWRIDDTCLWFDEMFGVQAAELPWAEMVRFLSLDLVHPPIFYALLKLWIGLGGDGIFWVRSLPALFGCLSIIPFILLCRELRQPVQVTVLAAFLFAVNGTLIKYSQEVRMYTLLMFVSLTSMWLFARYYYRGKSLAALVAVNVIAVYVHYYAWTFIGCEVLIVVIFQRERLRQALIMPAVVFSAFLPWIYAVATAAKAGDIGENIEWIQRPGPRVIFEYVLDIVEPFYFQTSSAEPASIHAITIPMLLLVGIAAAVWIVNVTKEADWENPTFFLLIFATLAPCAVFIASWLLPYSVWGTRHLIITVAPATILIAKAICSVPFERWRRAGIGLLILLIGGAGYLAARRDVPQYVWCGWEPLVASVASSNAGQVPVEVYASENLAAYHAWFTNRNNENLRIHIVTAPEGEFVDPEYFLPRGFDKIQRVAIEEITDSRVIIIYRRERPFATDWLLLRLEDKGYSACSPQTITFGQSTIVRAEMRRGVEGCIY